MATKKKTTEAPIKSFSKPTEKDFAVIIKPLITEKSMNGLQNENKVTLKVAPNATKTEIKLAFQRIFQVKVEDVRVCNVKEKETTRGTRYKGTIQGFKKAIVTVAEGQAIDLMKE